MSNTPKAVRTTLQQGIGVAAAKLATALGPWHLDYQLVINNMVEPHDRALWDMSKHLRQRSGPYDQSTYPTRIEFPASVIEENEHVREFISQHFRITLGVCGHEYLPYNGARTLGFWNDPEGKLLERVLAYTRMVSDISELKLAVDWLGNNARTVMRARAYFPETMTLLRWGGDEKLAKGVADYRPLPDDAEVPPTRVREAMKRSRELIAAVQLVECPDYHKHRSEHPDGPVSMLGRYNLTTEVSWGDMRLANERLLEVLMRK